MKKKSYLIIISLLFIASSASCSDKPSSEDFYKTALDDYHQNICAENYCSRDSDRFCSYINYNDNPCRVFGTLFFFLGTEVIKNENKEDAKNYPFIGNSYHQLTVVHTVKCSDIDMKSYKKSFENKLSKLKIDEFRHVNQIDVEVPDAQPMTSSKIYIEQFKWDRHTKKWQKPVADND